MQAEHLDRRNRRRRERGKTGDGGQAGVQHRPEQVADNILHRFRLVMKTMVGVVEFAEDMNRVGDGDRHQEDGDHRAHDVDIEAEADQQSHGADNRDNGNRHRRHDQGRPAEEQ